jgi:hypothetical protein
LLKIQLSSFTERIRFYLSSFFQNLFRSSEGDTLGGASLTADAVNLRAAAAVGGEVDAAAVSGVAWLGIDAGGLCQALQASALVGQNVLIPSNTGYVEKGGTLTGVIATGDGGSNIKVTVKDESGQVIREFAIEGSHKGNVAFEWDGKDKSGNEAKSGKYSIEAHATVDGKSESIPALTYAKVESVTLGTSTNPSTLKLKGLGGIYLTDVLEIGATTGKTTTQSASSSNAVI